MRTSLIALAMSVAAAGCHHLGGTAGPRPSWLDPAAAPPDAAELRYLVDRDTGRVFMEVPPPVLAKVRLQLYTSGREDLAQQIGRLYDLKTGRVRDAGHAKAAEARIRGPNAPSISPTPPEAATLPPMPPALPASAGGVLPGTRESRGEIGPDAGRTK
jgi:hypothetical protein